MSSNASFSPAVRQVIFSTLLLFVALMLVAGFLSQGEPFWQFTMWMGIALAIASAFAIWLAKRTIGPFDARVGALADGMGKLARGERAMVMPLAPGEQPVLVPLITQFNAMAAAVEKSLSVTRDQLRETRTQDAVTGLMNRRAFEMTLDESLESPQLMGVSSTLLYLNVDKFRVVADSHDLDTGDRLLKQIASRIREAINVNHLGTRITADEFALFIPGTTVEQGVSFAESVRARLKQSPFVLEGRSLALTASVGVVPVVPLLNKRQGLPNRASIYIADANAACQTAKEMGGDRVYAVFDSASQQRTKATAKSWVKRIHDAVENDEFLLVYQPIQPLNAPPVWPAPRYEVLLRMKETSGNFVMPMSFINVAERYDMMQSIDRWVITNALQQSNRLREQMGESAAPQLSINVSGHSLSSDTFFRFVERELARLNVSPKSICFELTETAAISHPERARMSIERLRQAGIRFWLDDFGSGLSSFNYLKHFPVDGIKIDGMFVRGMAKSYLDYALVEAIARVAKSLGLATVAEFVETEEVARKLAQLGVQHGQGYHFGRPAAIESVTQRQVH